MPGEWPTRPPPRRLPSTTTHAGGGSSLRRSPPRSTTPPAKSRYRSPPSGAETRSSRGPRRQEREATGFLRAQLLGAAGEPEGIECSLLPVPQAAEIARACRIPRRPSGVGPPRAHLRAQLHHHPPARPVVPAAARRVERGLPRLNRDLESRERRNPEQVIDVRMPDPV